MRLPSTDFYGRLNTGWNTSGTLRDVLLPNRNLISLEYNLQGRQIECYNNLTLSGTQIYYPAQDYMHSNHINIKSIGNMNINGEHRFVENSDFSLTASNNINIESGTIFNIESGAILELASGVSCSNPARIANALEENNLLLAEIPSYKALDINAIYAKYGIENTSTLQVYPNPNKGIFKVQLPITTQEIINKIQVVNNQGNVVYEDTDILTNEIDINDPKQGIYFLKIFLGNQILIHKILIN